MTARPNFDRKYYPTTVKNVIQRLPGDIQKALFEELAGNSLLYKDFMTDTFLATMRLTDLDKKFNKLDYFKSVFQDVDFPKTANKMNCYELYAIGCAAKYIKPEQAGLLFEKEYRVDKVQDFIPSKRRCKEIGKNYIKSILKQKVTEEVLHEFDFFIDDYVEMAMELKEKIDIKAGKKKIRKLHDEYAERAELIKMLKEFENTNTAKENQDLRSQAEQLAKENQVLEKELEKVKQFMEETEVGSGLTVMDLYTMNREAEKEKVRQDNRDFSGYYADRE